MLGLYLFWMLCVASAIIVPLCCNVTHRPEPKSIVSLNRVRPTSLDVMITCHPKDMDQLQACVEGVSTNIDDINNIYIISSEKPAFLIDNSISNVVWLSEKSLHFPFTLEYYLYNLPDDYKYRAGWYYQQMIKMHCDNIPSIQENVLILDADTVIVRPFKLFDDEGKVMFGYVDYFNDEYMKMGTKLDEYLKFPLWNQYSMIDHHMVINIRLLRDLRSHIFTIHKKPLWKLLGEQLKHVTHESSFSEYELYANFVYQYYPNYMILRSLNHINTGKPKEVQEAIERKHCDMISLHDYLKT